MTPPGSTLTLSNRPWTFRSTALPAKPSRMFTSTSCKLCSPHQHFSIQPSKPHMYSLTPIFVQSPPCVLNPSVNSHDHTKSPRHFSDYANNDLIYDDIQSASC